MQFPQITTKDLNGDKKQLPGAFAGDLNLLLVAYERWQQREVDSWLPLFDELESTLDGFRYYELPVVGRMNFFGRAQLDFWMRTGIQDRETRARTLTLYVDRAKFRERLGLGDGTAIDLVLLDGTGRVLWRGRGRYGPESARSLEQFLQETRVVAGGGQA